MLSAATPPTAPGRLPLHVQVSEMLIRDIQAGVLMDGERLPPERHLAETLNISVGTLRKALADLAEKGVLERVQGSGNYVRNRSDVDNVYAFFHLELLTGGGLPTAEVLTVNKLDKPSDLPRYGRAGHAFRIRRLRRLGGTSAALEEIWLDGVYADTLKKRGLSESLYRYYRDQLGCIIARAEDQVGIARVPDWRPQEFGSALDFWGHVERFSQDQYGNTAEYSRTWFDPETVRYVARWK